MMGNISNLTSARKIADTLTSSLDEINHKTVNLYMSYLCHAFAFIWKQSAFLTDMFAEMEDAFARELVGKTLADCIDAIRKEIYADYEKVSLLVTQINWTGR